MEQEQQDFIKELMEASEEQLTPKQAKIIQAAVEMFSEKGFAATSTSEIAKKAGVAEGTIFRHYKTKKDLLISIVTPVISKFAVPFMAEKFLSEVFDQESYNDIDKLLKKLIYNRFEFVKNNVPLIKILLQEMAYHQELQNSFKNVFVTKALPRFRKALEHFQEKEQIGDAPVETILRLTISTIMGFLLTRFILLPDLDWDDEREIEYTINYIRSGLKGI